MSKFIYDYYDFEYKDQSVSIVHDKFVNNHLQLIKSKISEGNQLYFVTLTLKYRQPEWFFREYTNSIMNRFHTRISESLDRTIFKNRPETVPILISFIEECDKKKLIPKSFQEHIQIPHFHGFLLIHENQYHSEKMECYLKENKIEDIWQNVKIENVQYCKKCTVRFVNDLSDENLRFLINYASDFMKNPEYAKYLSDTKSPYILCCNNPKLQSINRTPSMN